jgi:hypothetical protein
MSSNNVSYDRTYAIALLKLLPKGMILKSGVILGSVYGVPAMLFCLKEVRVRVLLTAVFPQTGKPEQPFVIHSIIRDERGDE